MITSYGIALVKQNKINNLQNQYEILMIKKRVTYAFITFVKGIYNKSNENELMRLFNKMTTDEKFTIMSLNFNIIWFKSTLKLPYDKTCKNKDNLKYEKARSKFENNFLTDNGKYLLSLLQKSKSSRKLWEIPKGMNNKNESAINTAIREFYEETRIKKNKYKILYNEPPIIHIFTDDNITYKYIYYLAILLDNKYNTNVNYSVYSHIHEICDLKFFNLNELSVINTDKVLIKTIKNIFKRVKFYF